MLKFLGYSGTVKCLDDGWRSQCSYRCVWLVCLGCRPEIYPQRQVDHQRNKSSDAVNFSKTGRSTSEAASYGLLRHLLPSESHDCKARTNIRMGFYALMTMWLERRSASASASFSI
ncbi:hypothetical protein AVEN_121261-1 [Araneus ventricosus]|uniref:Uncharacterized protein n=1 Tax=Araneus ventricosus TaxID=182803 RepID=A0A4Y2R741_ARAVE|nr:hypothetical protein AVEN_121261-1 [Araneus ventricosus]